MGLTMGLLGISLQGDPIVPDAFWVNPFGVHFGLMTPDILILVDHNGDILPDSGPIRNLNKAAFMIHSAIHMARPDILCAAHSHSMYGRAFSTLGKPLDMLTQNDCVFYNDHILFDEFNGVVLSPDEGQAIAAKLGQNKKAVILQNHGLITVANTIEGAVHLFIRLEESCRSQLMGYSSGAGLGIKPVLVLEEEAAQVHDIIGKPQNAWFSGLGDFKVLEEQELGEFGTWDGARTEMLQSL